MMTEKIVLNKGDLFKAWAELNPQHKETSLLICTEEEIQELSKGLVVEWERMGLISMNTDSDDSIEMDD